MLSLLKIYLYFILNVTKLFYFMRADQLTVAMLGMILPDNMSHHAK
ncbi:hypothetical protein Xekk_00211 [Xenorhabdus sp. KK7.4]|nr:hypothetical protein Xekk_00211 [Xenorhabdus sp. KK7.4]